MTLGKFVDGIRNIGVKRSFRRRGVTIYHIAADKKVKLQEFMNKNKFVVSPRENGLIHGEGTLYKSGDLKVLIDDYSGESIVSIWG